MRPRYLFALALLVATALAVTRPTAAKTCTRAIRICGGATKTGEVSAAFRFGTCVASARAGVLNGTTVQDVCNDLESGLNGDCGDDLYACAQDPRDEDCYILAQVTEGEDCDALAFSECCGISYLFMVVTDV